MYPASPLGYRTSPRGSLTRFISLIATLVVLYGALAVFVDMAPGPGRLVAVGSTPAWVCRDVSPLGLGGGKMPGGGAQIRCRYVPADARIPQRVAVGLTALLAASALFVAASRLTRAHPALA
jgi:hypothetical protein